MNIKVQTKMNNFPQGSSDNETLQTVWPFKNKMNILLRTLMVLLITLAFYSCTPGTTENEYHVAISGHDDNPGTKSKPFKTISAAAAVAQPGDTITVYGGIYRERVNPPRGGLSDSERITYRAAEGETVIIKGSEEIKGWERINNDVWLKRLPNSFFGDFNPYSDLISGDWFLDNKRSHHTGAVYLNGHWLNEAAVKEEVFEPVTGTPLWFAAVNESETTIWAQFPDKDPNVEFVEINVRQSVFYPETEGINYITVSGFKMEQAATPWAPPTAEQIGLIGTHWSKGWIIENNEISYSICSGITLGKYGDEYDNTAGNTAKGYVGTIERAIEYGWSKETIGSHIVRNNHIHHCEQAGIVGSLGAIFSTISGNEIHDIHVKCLFSGMEMGGIKIHAPIDMLISNNYVYNCWRGIWIDWMAQGTRVTGNLLHDNTATQDIFTEVNHGPVLIDNNILLSHTAIRDLSQGGAYAHNLFLGRFIPETNGRETPYHKEHATDIAGFSVIAGGDDRYYNNIFLSYNREAPWPERSGPVRAGNFFGLGAYDPEVFPMTADGNVYADQARAFKSEGNPVENVQFITHAEIINKEDGVYLEIKMDKNWMQNQRQLVTSELLGKAENPDAPFVNPDGTSYELDLDYFGVKRNRENPAPGPFERIEDGLMMVKVWSR
jgi:alpha-L-arabinofuranosidase